MVYEFFVLHLEFANKKPPYYPIAKVTAFRERTMTGNTLGSLQMNITRLRAGMCPYLPNHWYFLCVDLH